MSGKQLALFTCRRRAAAQQTPVGVCGLVRSVGLSLLLLLRVMGVVEWCYWGYLCAMRTWAVRQQQPYRASTSTVFCLGMQPSGSCFPS